MNPLQPYPEDETSSYMLRQRRVWAFLAEQRAAQEAGFERRQFGLNALEEKAKRAAAESSKSAERSKLAERDGALHGVDGVRGGASAGVVGNAGVGVGDGGWGSPR